MSEDLQKCVEIFTNHENYLQLGVYGGFFVITLVFAFMKKSLPSFVTDLMKAAVGAVSKKKEK